MAKSPKISASHEPGGLIVHISGLLPSLSPAEQRVARLVVSDPAAAARRTITDLATAAETSEATVIRFCRSVGMDGYPQLRIRLAAEAARRIEPPDARVVGGDIPPGADLAQIIATIAFNDARAVEETAEQLDPAVCEQVVEAISGAGRIDIYGAGASGFVASDFQQKLHRIGRIAFYFPDVHTALTSAALLGRGDVAIGISHTGTTSDVIEVLEQARTRGAATVALTNFPRSPITDVADFVLTTAARETTYRSGATASRLAQLTVVDCLFVGVAARNRARARKALEVDRRGGPVAPGGCQPEAGMTAGAEMPAPPARPTVRVGAPTERRNPLSVDLDLMSTRDVLTVINEADRRVPAAVAAVLDEIATTVDLAVEALRGGHRVHYFGAGTSGRLGVLDAAELAPTFNSPRHWFCAHLAGGPDAMWRAVEDAEDDDRGGAVEGGQLCTRRGPGGWSGGQRTHAVRPRGACRSPRQGRFDRAALRQSGGGGRPVGRRVHRGGHRTRGGHRVDSDEGGHRAEVGAQHVLDGRHGAPGAGLLEPHDRYGGHQREAPGTNDLDPGRGHRLLRGARPAGPHPGRRGPEDRARLPLSRAPRSTPPGPRWPARPTRSAARSPCSP